MEEKFYAMSVDNYACPSVCSSSEYYIGSLSDIRLLISGISGSRHKSLRENLESALDIFESGDKDVRHNVMYWTMQFLTEATVYHRKTVCLDDLECECENIYRCPYTLRGKQIEMEMLWIKYASEQGERVFNDEYARFVKYSIGELELYGSIGESEMHGSAISEWDIWGFPNLVQTKHRALKSNMYISQRTFEDEKSLFEDIENTEFEAGKDLRGLLLAIVGDG